MYRLESRVRTEKDRKRIEARVMKDLAAVGAPFEKPSGFLYEKLDGKCGYYRRDGQGFVVVADEGYLDKRVPERELRMELAHELIHSCPRCLSHGKTFLNYFRMLHERSSTYRLDGEPRLPQEFLEKADREEARKRERLGVPKQLKLAPAWAIEVLGPGRCEETANLFRFLIQQHIEVGIVLLNRYTDSVFLLFPERKMRDLAYCHLLANDIPASCVPELSPLAAVYVEESEVFTDVA